MTPKDPKMNEAQEETTSIGVQRTLATGVLAFVITATTARIATSLVRRKQPMKNTNSDEARSKKHAGKTSNDTKQKRNIVIAIVVNTIINQNGN